MPLNKIKQTSKTILFEEFDVTSKSMLEFVNYHKENSNELAQKIQKDLTVNTFKEFVEKFIPKVWLSTEYKEGSSYPEFRYSLECPHEFATPVELKSNEFYKMVMDLYNRKSISGEDNISFNYDIIDDLLAPEKVFKDAKKMRKQLAFNFETYLELEKDGKKKLELGECVEKINDLRDDIENQYKDNFPNLLKLALGDVNTQLAQIKKEEEDKLLTSSNDGVSVEDEKSIVKIGIPVFLDNGDISIKDLPSESLIIQDTDSDKSLNNIENLKNLIVKDFDEVAESNENYNNDFVKNLVVSSFLGSEKATMIIPSKAELIDRRDMYTEVYKKIQESFVSSISNAIEKMLNIKIFFDHATSKDGKLDAPLIVSNCRITDLLDGEETKEYFAKYLKLMNEQATPDKIWFAIIPAVADKAFADKASSMPSFDRKKSKFEKSLFDKSLVDLSKLKEACKLLQENKIITFFNFKGSEKTSFYNMNTEILKQYKDKLESLDGNEYAVFCAPNFTLVPKKNTNIKIGENENGDVFLEIPGIYVDASYVAAGITIASQNVKILKENGFDVKENYPCVRFEISNPINRFKLLTKMNCERNYSWNEEIEREAFGFFFSGTLKYIDGKRINQSYVISSKTMDNKGIYVPLVKSFISVYLHLNALNNVEGLKKFINTELNEWVLNSQNKKELANNIFIDGEGITLDNSSEVTKIKIKFNDVDEDIEIDVVEDITKN